jgi:hypothetical protein
MKCVSQYLNALEKFWGNPSVQPVEFIRTPLV